MKFLFIFVFMINIAFSQTKSISENNIQKINNTKTDIITYKEDFNENGEIETFEAVLISIINENTFWVKNATLTNANQKIVLRFDLNIQKNEKPIVNQVQANYGYIIELNNDKNTGKINIIVSIASEKGEKDSDELFINNYF